MGVVVTFWASQASRAHLQRESLSASIGRFANICRPAINQKAETFHNEIRLAPQVGLELGAFWLTALVVFSEPDTQARKVLLFLCLD
jgi:hypothetical protein